MSKRELQSAMKRQKRASGGWRSKKGLCVMIPLLLLTLVALGACGVSQPQDSGPVTPEQVRAEIIPQEGAGTSYGIPLSLSNTQRFIDYYNSITLTPQQEAVKRDALIALKAPCCDDNTMDRC